VTYTSGTLESVEQPAEIWGFWSGSLLIGSLIKKQIFQMCKWLILMWLCQKVTQIKRKKYLRSPSCYQVLN